MKQYFGSAKASAHIGLLAFALMTFRHYRGDYLYFWEIAGVAACAGWTSAAALWSMTIDPQQKEKNDDRTKS